MTSPFPGMDPYLESPVFWQDFHSTFVGALREQIADVLPGQYFAKIEEELVLLEPGEDDRYARSDVLVGREGRGVGEFWLPAGIFIDQSDRIWIADTYNRRIQVFEYKSVPASDTEKQP